LFAFCDNRSTYLYVFKLFAGLTNRGDPQFSTGLRFIKFNGINAQAVDFGAKTPAFRPKSGVFRQKTGQFDLSPNAEFPTSPGVFCLEMWGILKPLQRRNLRQPCFTE